MKRSGDANVFFQWQNPTAARRYQTGVSLHSHTLHSKECLSFISRVTRNVPYLADAIRRSEEKYKREHEGKEVDLTRAWWTPPLSGRQAWLTEKGQVETLLDLNGLVSLSDHDTIEAGVNLSVSDPEAKVPVSVEWTVPYRQTFFHIGVHNIPLFEAQGWMAAMTAFTASPQEHRIAELLDWWASRPEVLTILNHPMWDEKGVGAGLHWSLVRKFLSRHRNYIHALELNGLRPWRENQNVLTLAKSFSLPVISGGDRHGREPNACVNLTNATTFPEFVDEVRRDGWSDVLFLPQYKDSIRFRIIQNLCEILSKDPGHAMGWVNWTDRVFYLCDDGVERCLTELWVRKAPKFVLHFVSMMGLIQDSWVVPALRIALSEKKEPAL